MSYNAKPKDGYRIDKFLHKVPYEEVQKVYQDFVEDFNIRKF